MTYQVTTLRTVLGSQEKINTNFSTLDAAVTYAEAFKGTAVIKDLNDASQGLKGKLVGHFVNGNATGQTKF